MYAYAYYTLVLKFALNILTTTYITTFFSVLSHPFMVEHPFKDLEPLAIMAS